MNDTGQGHDELQDLLDEYLVFSLEEPRFRRLEEILLSDPEARARFVRYCRLDLDIKLGIRSQRAAERALERIGPGVGAVGKVGSKSIFRRLALPAAAGLILAALLLGLYVMHQSGSRAAIAWLANAQNCQWTGGAGAEPRGDLHPGQRLSIGSGLAEIHFASGASMVLEGPADCELVDGNSAKLSGGKLAATVPGQARGFSVLLPQGKVVDLGTEFGVAVAGDGTAQVRVFKGTVEASNVSKVLQLTSDQGVKISSAAVAADAGAVSFVRAIVRPPVVTPRTVTLDFRRPASRTILDRLGQGTGMTHRLPGTGVALASRDPNLQLNATLGMLELTTTKSDLNLQAGVEQAEYLGVRLTDLGFSGGEDFEASVSIANAPGLKAIGQFGLYAGTRSDSNIRGGLISTSEPEYRTFLVNNQGGKDSDLHTIGLPTPAGGSDLVLTLRRSGGRFTLTVGSQGQESTTLSIRHPTFLDNRADMYMGFFGTNGVARTLGIREFRVTVSTLQEPS